MTEKLYYADSHLAVFSALVLSCEQAKKGFAVVLDRTAFFPEGGGQSADTGTLGSARVLDAQERGGDVVHLCDAPLPVGERVEGRLDFERRLRRMQNHSGEHIVSGLVHNRFGFDNVGFHMGEDCMTIDFSGELSWEELMDVEQRANELVRENVPVRVWFPDAEELAALDYRSKLELTENVRIVEIPGADRCACCAPHVTRTGEIGAVKILDSQRHRGGVRLSVVCGMDALELFRAQQESVTEISRLLSAKRGEIAGAVRRVLAEQQRLKERCDALSAALIERLAADCAPTDGSLVLFDSLLDEIAQRELVNLLAEKCGGFAAVFCGADAEGWRYIIGSRRLDLRAMAKTINAAVNGRGGGRPEMITGRAAASREEIESGLKSLIV
ncbi:MAG: hypothetical protein K6F56_02280 [Oscillospiraceae bacterium]|nr:hypothetical protein [Oscillospiraceae bacterium]